MWIKKGIEKCISLKVVGQPEEGAFGSFFFNFMC
jgi:hypothetical protein